MGRALLKVIRVTHSVTGLVLRAKPPGVTHHAIADAPTFDSAEAVARVKTSRPRTCPGRLCAVLTRATWLPSGRALIGASAGLGLRYTRKRCVSSLVADPTVAASEEESGTVCSRLFTLFMVLAETTSRSIWWSDRSSWMKRRKNPSRGRIGMRTLADPDDVAVMGVSFERPVW